MHVSILVGRQIKQESYESAHDRNAVEGFVVVRELVGILTSALMHVLKLSVSGFLQT